MTPFQIRKILKLSFPVMAAFFSYHILGITDMLMVGALGTPAVAAVGVAVTVSFFLVGPMEGFLDAATILLSQAWGRRDRAGFLSDFHHALVWALLGGVLAVFLAFPLTFVLPFFAPDPGVRELAQTYLLIIALSWIPQFLGMVLTRYFLSQQKNTVVALVSNLTVVLNIVLNFLFIFGMGDWKGWGVAGSAAATLTARIFQLLVLGLLVRQDLAVPGEPSAPVRITRSGLARFAAQGFPLAQSNLAEFGAWFLFVGFIGQLGTASLAAHEISMKIKDIGYIFGWALATVGTTLVGEAVGAGQSLQARRAVQGTTLVAMTIMGLYGLVFLIFPEALLRFFTQDPLVLAQAVPLLQLMALYQLVDAVYVGYRSGLGGLGDVRFVRNVSLVGGWLIMAAGAYLFTRVWTWGLLGAWVSLTVYVLAASVVYVFRFRKKVAMVGTKPAGAEFPAVISLGAEEKL